MPELDISEDEVLAELEAALGIDTIPTGKPEGAYTPEELQAVTGVGASRTREIAREAVKAGRMEALPFRDPETNKRRVAYRPIT